MDRKDVKETASKYFNVFFGIVVVVPRDIAKKIRPRKCVLRPRLEPSTCPTQVMLISALTARNLKAAF
jgi:hypothetical protein